MTTLLVGLLAAASAALLTGAVRTEGFGQAGGWCARWNDAPGTVGGLLASLGRVLLRPGRPAPRAVRTLARFLLCSPEAAAGMLVGAAVLGLSGLVFGWGIGPLFLLAHAIRARGRQRDEGDRARRSWEIDVTDTLRTLRLQVAAGRPLQPAVEACRETAAGVAVPLLAELAARWSAGEDSGSAFDAIAGAAPDASTAAFFSRLAGAVRAGEPLLPVLDAEVDRLRTLRRQRLQAELERLPTRLVLFRGLMMLAAGGPIAAFALVMMESFQDLL